MQFVWVDSDDGAWKVLDHMNHDMAVARAANCRDDQMRTIP
jgi:hypothetical protein